MSPRCVTGTHQIFVFFTWLSFPTRRMSPAPSLKVQGSHRYKYLLQLFRFVSLLSLSHCSFVTWLSFSASRVQPQGPLMMEAWLMVYTCSGYQWTWIQNNFCCHLSVYVLVNDWWGLEEGRGSMLRKSFSSVPNPGSQVDL